MKRIFIQSLFLVFLLTQHWDVLGQCTVSGVTVTPGCDGNTRIDATLGPDVNDFTLQVTNNAGDVLKHSFPKMANNLLPVAIPTAQLAVGDKWVITGNCDAGLIDSQNGEIMAGDLTPADIMPSVSITSIVVPNCPSGSDGTYKIEVTDPSADGACDGTTTYSVMLNGTSGGVADGGSRSGSTVTYMVTGASAGSIDVDVTSADMCGSCSFALANQTSTMPDGTFDGPIFDVQDQTGTNGTIATGAYTMDTRMPEITLVNGTPSYTIPAGDCAMDICFLLDNLDDDCVQLYSGAILEIDGEIAAQQGAPSDFFGTPGYSLCADGLAAGTYTGKITMFDLGSNETVTPEFTITVAEEDPNPTVTPTGDFTFAYTQCDESIAGLIGVQITDNCETTAETQANASNLSVTYNDYVNNGGAPKTLTGDIDPVNTPANAFFEFELDLTEDNDGEEVVISYMDTDGNTTTERVVLNVSRTEVNSPVVDASDAEFTAAACEDRVHVNYTFHIYDCAGFDASTFDFDDFGIDAKARNITSTNYIDLSTTPISNLNGATGIEVKLSGYLFAPSTYTLEIDYKGQFVNPSIKTSTVISNENLVLACNDNINVTLDEYCNAPLLPDNVLEGFPSGLECAKGYYVKVIYPYDGHTIDRVKECGEFKYIAYKVVGTQDWIDGDTAPSGDYDVYPDEEICWGYVTAEDKTPPTACIRKVIGLYKSEVEYETYGDYFLTNKEPKEINRKYYEYDPVTYDPYDCEDDIVYKSHTTVLDDPYFNLLICTDLDSIYNVEYSWTDDEYAYYTGTPELFDNCGDGKVTLIDVDDKLEDLECAMYPDYYFPGRLVSAVIHRTFVFEDEKGNRGEVTQDICFYKPTIYLPECKKELDLCWYGDADPDNTEEELAPGEIHSAPYYYNAACMKMYLDEHVCEVTVTYEDLVLPGPTKCGFKVIRTWTLLDWCWNEDLYDNIDLVDYYNCEEARENASWHNKALTYEQHLIVGDSYAPVPQHPDTDWDGYPGGPMIFSTGPFDCTGAFDVPAPIIYNKECNYTWTVHVYANVPVLWHGVPTGQYELKHFTEADVIVDNDLATWETKSVKVVGVPKGHHYLKYVVEDHCGNVGESYHPEYIPDGYNHTFGYVPFYVIDEIEPVAVCDDDLTVSITAGAGGDANPYGFGRVYAADVDEGSWDNCTDVYLQVRRFVPEDCVEDFQAGSSQALETKKVTIDKPGTLADGLSGYWTVWADYVDFVCCDIGVHPEEGKVLVELGVWDDANMSGVYNDKADVYGDIEQYDNFNTCWLEVLLEDKIAPVCIAPHDLAFNCDVIPYNVYVPEDGTKWADLSDEDKDHMRAWFGSISDAPKAWDNCSVTVEMTDVIFDMHCKAGSITRVFQATDAWGRTSATCKQEITFFREHDYCIKFPKDAEAECLEDPDIPGVELFEYACDLLAVSVQDERFDVPTSSNECYKLFRTYRVLNWCQFDEDVDPGTPLFDRFDTAYDVEPLVVNRDEDQDGKPGDEDVYVRFIGGEYDDDRLNEIERIYDYYGATYDVEGYPDTYGITTIDDNCIPDDYEHYDPEDGYHRYNYYSRGFYQYTQVIKVYDAVPPVVVGIGEESFPSYASPDLDDKASDFANGLPTVCVGDVTIDVQVSEICTQDYVVVKKVYLLPDADLGVGTLPLYDGGAVTEDGDAFGFAVSAGVAGDEGTVFTLTGSFPIGEHELEVHVIDGCGNVDSEIIPFEVYDAKAPSPICISGLSIELMPDGEGSGAMAIWANDFIASDIWDCSEPIKYTIHRAEEIDSILAAGETVTYTDEDASLVVTCDDPEVVLVYIFSWDAAGNGDRCEAMLLVNDFMGLCGPVAGASVAGLISTEEDRSVSDVQVELSGQMNDDMMTTNTGNYGFTSLTIGQDYTITPLKDVEYKNGVSTFDLVVISKHILGVEALDSPYKLIAADANNSRSITTLDLIQFRRLILSIDQELSNNTSWRFVDARYDFPNDSNPWAEQFPELININDLEDNMLSGDFIAVKIGDVTGDAETNGLVSPRNIAGTFTMNVEDQALLTGNEYKVAFTAADLAQVQGYQFTLNLDADVAFVDIEYGVAGEENFGFAFLNDGAITTSWNGEASDKVLFTMVVRANADVQLSEVLKISSRYTTAEAYSNDDELLDVALNFGQATVTAADFSLYQNTPNPFNGETKIGFSLPEAAKATLTIQDVAGRTLQVIRRDFAKGYNEVVLDGRGLAPGVLMYTLESDEFTATKKMILSK